MASEHLSLYEQLLKNPKYQQRVERIARSQTRNTSSSWEDAVQAAHEKVFQATQAGKFQKGGVNEFYRWAATVAKFQIIDLVRKEKQSICQSLDQNIPGTNLPLSEAIADKFNLFDALERTDLINRVIDAIIELDRHYPERGYVKLWQGHIQGKKQCQIAAELGVTQGAISKRWQELRECVVKMLGIVEQKIDSVSKY
jgi:RNA polymerase sigma factor (sigma-70 family)